MPDYLFDNPAFTINIFLLQKPELQHSRFADHIPVPGWLESKRNFCIGNPFGIFNFLVQFYWKTFSNRAIGSGKCHGYMSHKIVINQDGVNKSEIVNVHRDFRIVYRFYYLYNPLGEYIFFYLFLH